MVLFPKKTISADFVRYSQVMVVKENQISGTGNADRLTQEGMP